MGAKPTLFVIGGRSVGGPLDLEARLETLAESVADRLGLALVGLSIRNPGRGPRIVVTIDKAGGVTVDDCQEVSRRLQDQIEVDGLLAEPFTLEVESPGLDRLLKTDREFRHFLGRQVEVRTSEPVAGRSHFVGRLGGLENGCILLEQGEKGETLRIPRAQISRARLHVPL